MTRGLAILAGLAAFVLCLIAVRDQAELKRTGYRVSAQEKGRDKLSMEKARLTELVGRLGSPAVLAQHAEELGLSTRYPTNFVVVRIGADFVVRPLLVRNE